MKIVKIEIQKTRNWNRTDYSYPVWYDANEFDIISYQNEWLKTEYAIAKCKQNLSLIDWIVEITKWKAQSEITRFINSDKDISDVKLVEKWKSRADFILKRIWSLD